MRRTICSLLAALTVCLGLVASSGNSTGPHLHFSVLRNGTDYVDPVPWLAQRGLSPGSYVG